MAVRNGLGFPAILVSKTNAKLYDQTVISCVRLSFMSLQYTVYPNDENNALNMNFAVPTTGFASRGL